MEMQISPLLLKIDKRKQLQQLENESINFCEACIQPKTHIMNNEYSHQLKIAIDKESITYQLVPPYVHRANNIERVLMQMKYLLRWVSCAYTLVAYNLR